MTGDAVTENVDDAVMHFSLLVDRGDIDGAEDVAQRARDHGSVDAARMLGVVRWLREDREAALALWSAAVADGDDSALAYLARAAIEEPEPSALRSEVLDRLTRAVRGPNGVIVAERLVASVLTFPADEHGEEWNRLCLGLLLEAAEAGHRQAVDLYVEVCGRDVDELACDETTSPVVLAHLVGRRTGMSAWYACANPSLPEAAARLVMAGEAESLVRALAGNAGLSPEIRDAATRRLAVLAGDGASHPAPASAEAGSAPVDVAVNGTRSEQEPTLREAYQALVDGDFESVLGIDLHAAPLSADDLYPVAVALAWRAEQQSDWGGTLAMQAREACDRIASADNPVWALYGALTAVMVTVRHGLDDVTSRLQSAIGLMGQEADSVPVYATSADVSRLAEMEGCHPWTARWFTDHQQLKTWLAQSFPLTAGDHARKGGDLIRAEACYRAAGGDPSAYVRGRALNSLVEGCLLPQERLDEAEVLLTGNAGSVCIEEASQSRVLLGIIAWQRGEYHRAQRELEGGRQGAAGTAAREADYHLALLDRQRGDPTSALRRLFAVATDDGLRAASLNEGVSPPGTINRAAAAFADLVLSGASLDDAGFDSEAGAEVGCVLKNDGRRADAMRVWERAAARGSFGGLCNLIWQHVLCGEIEQAISVYEQYIGGIDGELSADPAYAEVNAHIRSNAALAYMAAGQVDRAGQLWNQAAQAGLVEARVHPAVLPWRRGDRATAAEMVATLSEPQLVQFISETVQALTEATGWFQQWATHACDLVQALPHLSPVTASDLAHLMYCHQPKEGVSPTFIASLRAPAEAGVPSALASLVEQLRLAGEAAASVAAFELSAAAMDAYLEALPPLRDRADTTVIWRGQMAPFVDDALTEVALSYLLIGRVADAQRVWSDPRLRLSAEAKVSLAALALRDGSPVEAGRHIRTLLPAQREEIDAGLAFRRKVIADREFKVPGDEQQARWYEECRRALDVDPGIRLPER